MLKHQDIFKFNEEANPYVSNCRGSSDKQGWVDEICLKRSLFLDQTLIKMEPKVFMKALKAFIKPFETPQRGVKIKILS